MNWNKHNRVLALACLALTITALNVSAKEETTGTIKGQVNYCSQGGYVGMQVFIPGRQFTAFLGQDGSFILEGVPAGSFNLNYLVNGKLVHETNKVMVSAGETADLGMIAFCDREAAEQGQPTSSTPAASTLSNCEESPELPECQDADKDGVTVMKDCNDKNASVYPGADELCDGVDNNCDGKVDEVLTMQIQNGVGLCENSVVIIDSCSKGFADCDKNPANGCETDIYNDNHNCGACGNECSTLEICKLGIC